MGYCKWSIGEFNVGDPLHIAADGRFAIVILRSSGESSSMEVQDGLGDAMGAERGVGGTGHYPVSSQCGHGYYLGGARPDDSQGAWYDGQIAEVMVYDRTLTSAERRVLVSYLRRKYDLDVLDALQPAGTQLMQAEDFDGPWQLSSPWDFRNFLCLGHRHVIANFPKTTEGIKRSVLITQPGKYSVWVRAIAYGRESGLRTSIGGRPLGLTHIRGPMAMRWELAGQTDLPAGETEIVVRGEGPGDKECDAVLISSTVATEAGVEEFCALAQRLRRTPSPGQVMAVFDDGRRIEGDLVSGWRCSGVHIAREGGVRPRVRCLKLDCLPSDPASMTDALLELHNGDRIRGILCGYKAASAVAGKNAGPFVLVQPSQEFGKAVEGQGTPIAVDIQWLRRIVFDAGSLVGPLPATVVGLP